jgi:hypothetical protein
MAAADVSRQGSELQKHSYEVDQFQVADSARKQVRFKMPLTDPIDVKL